MQGEEQKKLDVITNTVLKNALRFSGKMAVLASEEEDAPVAVADDAANTYEYKKEVIVEEGQVVAVFDPLDGSSNVDANIPAGCIFGIYEEPEAARSSSRRTAASAPGLLARPSVGQPPRRLGLLPLLGGHVVRPLV